MKMTSRKRIGPPARRGKDSKIVLLTRLVFIMNDFNYLLAIMMFIYSITLKCY